MACPFFIPFLYLILFVMKLLIALTLLLTASFFGLIPKASAQKDKKAKTSYHVKVGDKYFKNEDYYLAAQSYQKALRENQQDAYAAMRLGDAYKAYFDYKQAENAYRKALANNIAGYPETRFWYAMMLKTNNKHEEAATEFQAFEQAYRTAPEKDDELLRRSKLEREGALLAISEMKKPARNFSLRALPAPVNSSASDYAPTIMSHDSLIVITTARQGVTGGNNRDPRLGGMFSDNLRFEKSGGTWYERDASDNLYKMVNTVLSEGAGVFGPDNKSYYYTNCTGEYCGIYVTYKKGNDWQKPVPLSINTAEYSTKQPSISAMGDTLYFVSDRPGGKGQNDIWYAVKETASAEENTAIVEQWGQPVNLEAVNTPYIDMSPCYYNNDGKRVLFFSSNGRESFGGLDIFMAEGANFQTVLNAGLPFNSSRDDFYFVIGENLGYLSSNREGGKGQDDVYAFALKNTVQLIETISQDSITGYEEFLLVHSKSLADPAADPKADVSMANGKMSLAGGTAPGRKQANLQLDEMSTQGVDKLGKNDASGLTQAKINRQKLNTGNIQPAADASMADNKMWVTQAAVPAKQSSFRLAQLDSKGSELIAEPIKENSGDFTPLQQLGTITIPNADAALADSPMQLIMKSAPGKQSSFRLDQLVTKNDVQLYGAQVWVSAKPKYYEDPAAPFFESKILKERKIQGTVYFAYNSPELTPQAQSLINNLVKYIGNHDNIKIEVSSHTDAIGTHERNDELSFQRGQQAWNYLTEKGIPADKLIINSHGERMPAVSNADSKNMWQNRRIEFYVLVF